MSRSKKRKFLKTGIAPLVQTDIHELGDERLDPAETVAREREQILAIESKKKIAGQKELENTDRVYGPRLTYSDLIRRLQKCNPEIRVKDGSPGSVALYVRKKPSEYTEAELAGDKPPGGQFFVDHKYVGGFLTYPPLPEWGFVMLDTSEIAVREYRSWRSVLIRLIKERVISYKAAVEEFGDPSSDKRSGRWFQQLASYR